MTSHKKKQAGFPLNGGVAARLNTVSDSTLFDPYTKKRIKLSGEENARWRDAVSRIKASRSDPNRPKPPTKYKSSEKETTYGNILTPEVILL